jgi:ribA/ribD-fused uncharacterized protein
MFTAVYAKFSQNEHMKDFLIRTGDCELIEANRYDDFWGVGLSLRDVDNLKDHEQWKGLNKLGKILTQVREALKS